MEERQTSGATDAGLRPGDGVVVPRDFVVPDGSVPDDRRRPARADRGAVGPGGDGPDGPQAAPTVTERLVARVDDSQTWLLGLPVSVLAFGAWSHRWVTDDAFINLRVVDMTLHGHVLAFNAGERVEAGTSPLWVLTLTALKVALGWFLDISWLAVLCGLGLTLFGLGAGMAASVTLIRHVEAGARLRLFPAGTLVLAVLPPVWDFATSGLETGMTFGWIGACYWFLACRYVRGPDDSPLTPWWGLVLLGLGPLIRPDLLIFSAAFLVVHLGLSRADWPTRAKGLAVAAALPVLFEIFRMGYFANLVPNTALTKEAGEADFAKGLAYVDNLVSPYFLWVPLVLLTVWALTWFATPASAGGRRFILLMAVPFLASVAHAAYVVRVGGDFMHGRLLLPAAFGILLSAAVLPLSRRHLGPAVVVCAGGLACWAVLCGSEFRLPAEPQPRWSDIVDERLAYTGVTGKKNPITIGDYDALAGGRTETAKRLGAEGADALVLLSGDVVPLAPGSGVVVEADTLGAVAYASGPDVRMHDLLGLADAVGSRITADRDLRIGHRKAADRAWELARLSFPAGALEAADKRATEAATHAADGAPPPILLLADPTALDAARRAVRCPAVQDILEATEAPLTPARFLANIVEAPRLTKLRIPRTPTEAASCRAIR
jgi:arabinofuranosyltransferase